MLILDCEIHRRGLTYASYRSHKEYAKDEKRLKIYMKTYGLLFRRSITKQGKL